MFSSSRQPVGSNTGRVTLALCCVLDKSLYVMCTTFTALLAIAGCYSIQEALKLGMSLRSPWAGLAAARRRDAS